MEIDPTLKQRLLDLIRQYSETDSLKSSVKNQIIPMLITELIEKHDEEKENRSAQRRVWFNQPQNTPKSIKVMNTRQALKVAEDAEYESSVSSYNNVPVTLHNIKTQQCINISQKQTMKVVVKDDAMRGTKILLNIKKTKKDGYSLARAIERIYQGKLRVAWLKLTYKDSKQIHRLVEVIAVILRKNKKEAMEYIKEVQCWRLQEWQAWCMRKMATSVLTLQTSLWRLRQLI